MATRRTAAEAATLRLAHTAVQDLLRPRMSRYWADFGCSFAAVPVLFTCAALLGPSSPWSWPLVVLSGLALYRAAAFIHEIVHFSGRRSFRLFRRTWNALVGVPFLIPLFMYECHAEHHNWRHYGTARDAEYLPLARLSRWRIAGIVAAIPLLPLYGPFRFGVLGPLAWARPSMRQRVWRRSSALKLDVEYVGAPPDSPQQRRSWVQQEVAAALVVALLVVLAVTGVVPPAVYVQLYSTYAVVVLLNTFRLLGAHRYLGDEDAMSVLEQVADTLNYPRRRPLAELWAPVGLRLHALHHLMPGLPYHAYPAAHERLLAALPEGSVYHQAAAPGLVHSLRVLWRTSGHRADIAGLSPTEATEALARPAQVRA